MDNGSQHSDLAADLRLPEDSELPSTSDRRHATRYEINKRVPVTMDGFGTGRLHDISRQGGIFIEARNSVPFRSDVVVTARLRDGTKLIFVGRVVRLTDRGFGAHLRSSKPARDFIERFLDEALDEDPKAGTLELEICEDMEHSQAIADLSARWYMLRHEDSDDEQHQAFIERCMKHKEIPFALECYRAWKKDSPDDPRPDRYLSQLSKIIGFYAFDRPKGTKKARGGSSRRATMFIVSILILAALSAFGVMLYPKLMRGGG